MAASFDLNLLPSYRVKGQEWPHLPGLQTALPPKRPARGREDDRLFSYLTLSGNIPFTSAEYTLLSTMLAERFYKSPGALTSALRAAAEALNHFLVERNLRTTGKGQYVVGRLVLGVPRGGQLLLAQCGPTHIFHLTRSETRHIHEEQAAGRGLGVGQSTPIHFAQVDLHPGDVLAVCSALPAGWEEALLAEHSGPLETLRRKLHSLSGDDLDAILVQAQAGKGAITVLHGTRAVGETPPPAADLAPAPAKAEDAAPEAAPARPVSQVVSGQPASRFARLIAGQTEEQEKASDTAGSPLAPNEPASRPRQVITPPPLAGRQKTVSRPGRFVGPRPSGGELPKIIRPQSPQRQQMFRGLAKWLRGVRVLSRNISEKIRAFLPNLLPDLSGEEPRVPGASLAFMAIAIPILIVTAALIFYNQQGKTASYKQNYDLAFASAVWASGQTSPSDIRVGWERTLYYLDAAEGYQKTDDSQQLRRQAQTALDNLDNILRLDFKPAIIEGVSRTVTVTRMAATTTDLYLLDSSRGLVLRYYVGAQGYLADTKFACGAGTYDGVVVGALIDIIAAPKVNPYNATLMALDSNGALIYCSPSPSTPKAIQLGTPELGWSGITAFTLDYTTGYLYILDPATRAIWYYAPDQYGKFTVPPKMFFGEQVPANMVATIDLATNGADMYLLFDDGRVAACTLIEFQGVPKRCVDPVQFIDNRPERQSGEKIADAAFTQMTFAEAPDQSLYFFDPYAQAVYRFGARPDSLTLLGQFRAPEDKRAAMLAETAAAMTISPNRGLFISVSGQVYYAANIP